MFIPLQANQLTHSGIEKRKKCEMSSMILCTMKSVPCQVNLDAESTKRRYISPGIKVSPLKEFGIRIAMRGRKVIYLHIKTQ
jgi:hypothetical protein